MASLNGAVERTVYSGGRVCDAANEADHDFVWVNLTRPTYQQMAAAVGEFGLEDFLVRDAVAAHQRPRLDCHERTVQVVLKPVHYVDREEVVEVTELNLFLGQRFLVTVQHGDTDVLGRAHANLDASPGLSLTPTDVLVRVAEMVIEQYEDAIDGLRNDVDEIEEAVFSATHADHAERIYKLKREVAEFRRAVDPLGRVLDRLANQNLGLEAEAAPRFGAAHHHLLQVADSLDGIDRLLTDVLQANVARVTAKQSEIALRQNEDMRKISAWAAIALVPTAVAGIYGMNFDHMPELRWRLGYPMALGFIALVCFGLYRTFRANRWL
ncbi:MAG: magnesium and cobalt transport protein CorA [Sporichthyaceae bacterium]